MKPGIDIPDENYCRIPKEDLSNLISWGKEGYVVQDPWGNQTAKWYPGGKYDKMFNNVEVQVMRSQNETERHLQTFSLV